MHHLGFSGLPDKTTALMPTPEDSLTVSILTLLKEGKISAGEDVEPLLKNLEEGDNPACLDELVEQHHCFGIRWVHPETLCNLELIQQDG